MLEAVDQLALAHAGSTTAKQVTVSIGVGTLVPDARTRPADLVAITDERLYHAKRNGRHRVSGNEEA